MNAEFLATTLAGFLAVPILQLIKRYTKLSGTPMAFAAYFLSWPIAAIALVTLTDLKWVDFWASPEKLALHGSAVAALAMLVYRVIAEKMGLGETVGRR